MISRKVLDISATQESTQDKTATLQALVQRLGRLSRGVAGNKFLSRQSRPVVCARCQISFKDGGETRNLNMALESTSNQAKIDIFKDVRFFLAEENNEEV